MANQTGTVEEYIKGLPAERQEPVRQLVELIRRELPSGYEESMEWGMPTYQVPLSVYPDTYNKQPLMYAAVASQKNHLAVYLMTPYMDRSIRQILEDGFRKAGKKLDMGKSCLRFKELDDIPLDVVGNIIAAVPMEEYVAAAKRIRSRQQ